MNTSLTTRTANWFECILRYERTQEDGLQKKVTETYVVDALSFTEAEARITEEMKQYISGDFEVKNINPCPFHEIIFSEEATDDRWFLARLDFITIDGKTEKEKHAYVSYLIQASIFDAAKSYIQQVMSGTMVDYVIKSIKETKYLDVFQRQASTMVPDQSFNL